MLLLPVRVLLLLRDVNSDRMLYGCAVFRNRPCPQAARGARQLSVLAIADAAQFETLDTFVSAAADELLQLQEAASPVPVLKQLFGALETVLGAGSDISSVLNGI